MLRPRHIQRSGYLVITSDKGLAGAYSSNVLKRLINDINEKHTNSDEYSIIVLGQSGVDFLKNRGYEVESSLVDVPINLHLNQYKLSLSMRLTYSVKNILMNLRFIIATMLVFLKINLLLNKFYHYLKMILVKAKVKCRHMNLNQIKTQS